MFSVGDRSRIYFSQMVLSLLPPSEVVSDHGSIWIRYRILSEPQIKLITLITLIYLFYRTDSGEPENTWGFV